MADIRTFRLPDLGEGLPDATIVEWRVKPGGSVRLDDPLVSMETAKAIVDVPSPYSGKLIKVYGSDGDIIDTGAPLADFDIDASAPQRSDAGAHGHRETPASPSSRADAGTVVGTMESGDRVVSESAVVLGGVKAMPAVRALARKLGVNLAAVAPSGAEGVVTLGDVRKAAAAPPAASAELVTRLPTDVAAHSAPHEAHARLADTRAVAEAVAPSPDVTAPAPSAQRIHSLAYGTPQPIKGARRNMARVMADAQSKVVLTTIFDDADVHAWQPDTDISVRLLRAIVVGCKAVPALNAWFDGEALTRTLHPHVDIGIAVDTADGLFVPALRNADVLDAAGLRGALDSLLRQVRDRSILPRELAGYTISLSNFGVFAGRYATPIVVPPCVAIVAAGKLRDQLVAVMGGVESHRVVPLSLSFDHRAATGGEAARFLKAMLDDLAAAR